MTQAKRTHQDDDEDANFYEKLAAVEPVFRFPQLAEAECFQPRDRVEREPVVHQRDVDIGSPLTSTRPRKRAGM